MGLHSSPSKCKEHSFHSIRSSKRYSFESVFISSFTLLPQNFHENNGNMESTLNTQNGLLEKYEPKIIPVSF